MAAHDDIFEAMRNNKNGNWRPADFDRLYRGFGFQMRQGKHVVYTHSKYPQLSARVARHKTLATGYTVHAIKCIEELKGLMSMEEETDGSGNKGE